MRRRTFLSAIAGATVIGGLAIGAVAAQTSGATPGYGSMHANVMTGVAAKLGVTEAALIGAFDQAHADALADAISAGNLTQQQADAMKAHHGTMATSGLGPGMHGGFNGGLGSAMHGAFGGMMGERYGQGGPSGTSPSR